jgi:hypothetical protein
MSAEGSALHPSPPKPVAFFQKSFSTTLAPKEGGGTSAYLNPSKLDPDGGSMRFHVLSDEPITGFELWIEKAEGGMVPRRTASAPDPALIAEFEAEVGGRLATRDGRPQISTFAAFFAYDYADDAIKVFSATQKTILRELDRLTSDPDYAELSQWDCQITRKGKGTDTIYSVDLKPTKCVGATAARIKAAWAEAESGGADLTALFTGGNPLAPSA